MKSERLCVYCRTNRKHPLYLYMIGDRRVSLNRNLAHIDQYVGLSSLPFVHEHCHNRIVGYKAAKKTTKALAPHWRLLLAVPVGKGAMALKADLTKMSRKFFGRLVQVCEYAARHKQPVYTRYPKELKQLYMKHYHSYRCKS